MVMFRELLKGLFAAMGWLIVAAVVIVLAAYVIQAIWPAL
jgi:hypothetical protein